MITIITPSFNQGIYVERTIQSVLRQNIPKLEYIVIDGGSTDNTLTILDYYSEDLTYISEQDKGQSDAVNKGLRKASHEIIGWLNSDDIYYPDTLRIVLNYFDKHPDVDVIYGKANHIDQLDHIIEPYPVEKWNLKRLKQTCYISQPAVFFRKRILAHHGLLNENLHFCMDYEFWLRLAIAGVKFAFLPQVLSGSRLYKETKTLRAPLEAHREVVNMLREKLGYVPVNWLITEAILVVKNKTKHKMPELRYFLWVLGALIILVFKKNSFFRAIKAILELPKAWALRCRKKFKIASS